MASSKHILSRKRANPVVSILLKPIKTKLRLKKDDVHQCRLCLRVLPRADILETTLPGSDLCQRILDAVLVEICPYDKVTTVCINCITMVDIINDFRMTCRIADTLHGTKLMMMHPGSWLNENSKQTLVSCVRIVKRNRVEMDALYKCSGVNNEEIRSLIKERQIPSEPVMESTVELEETTVKATTKCNEDDQEMTEASIDDGPSLKEEDSQADDTQKLIAKKEAKMYMCELCGKLMQKMYMEHHVNMHMGLKPYECSEENCNKTFASQVVMSIHVINVHKKEKERFQCETCHKSIKGLSFYNQHLQTHQSNNSLKVPCKVCGKTFYKRYLRDHMFVHTGETPYSCEFCHRKFAAKNNLAVHRRKQHADQIEAQ